MSINERKSKKRVVFKRKRFLKDLKRHQLYILTVIALLMIVPFLDRNSMMYFFLVVGILLALVTALYVLRKLIRFIVSLIRRYFMLVEEKKEMIKNDENT